MKKIFSGVQPSGNLHLGNYLGALKQWAKVQDEAECIFCIVDLHAITVPQDHKVLKEKILEVAALYIASGIDPTKSKIFVQSDRPEHSELAWILNTIVTAGMLTRMTQYKAKVAGILAQKNLDTEEFEAYLNRDNGLWAPVVRWTPFGLLTYPVLMAADILLYQTTHVPVGEDQKQHIEITRDLAQRINNKYKEEIFTIPEPLIKKETARIMGLDDCSKKMSKSAPSPANYIALTDDDDTIRNKIKKAVTDSGDEIKAGPDKPAITNLLNIFSAVTDKSVADIEQEFIGKNYGIFKEALAEAVIAELKPVREKFISLIADKETLRKILAEGANKVAPEAQATLKKVKEAIGLG
jgi:tryptophanyl-tRNA synthetase